MKRGGDGAPVDATRHLLADVPQSNRLPRPLVPLTERPGEGSIREASHGSLHLFAKFSELPRRVTPPPERLPLRVHGVQHERARRELSILAPTLHHSFPTLPRGALRRLEKVTDRLGGKRTIFLDLLHRRRPLVKRLRRLPASDFAEHPRDDGAISRRLLRRVSPRGEGGEERAIREATHRAVELRAHLRRLLAELIPLVEGAGDGSVAETRECLLHLLAQILLLLNVIHPPVPRPAERAEENAVENLTHQLLLALQILHHAVPSLECLHHRLLGEAIQRSGEFLPELDGFHRVLFPPRKRRSSRGVLHEPNSLPHRLALLLRLEDALGPRLERSEQRAVDEILHRATRNLRLLAKLEPALERARRRPVGESTNRLGQHLLVLALVLDEVPPALERLVDLAVGEESKRVARLLRRLHVLFPSRERGTKLPVGPPRHRARRNLPRLALIVNEVLPLLPSRAQLLVLEPRDEPGHPEPHVRDVAGVVSPGVEARGFPLVEEKVGRLVEQLAVFPSLAHHLAPSLPRGAVLEPPHHQLRRRQLFPRLLHRPSPRAEREHHAPIPKHVRRALEQRPHLARLLHHIRPSSKRPGERALRNARRYSKHLLAKFHALLAEFLPTVERPGDGAVAQEPECTGGERAVLQRLVDIVAPHPQCAERDAVAHNPHCSTELLSLVKRLAPVQPTESREATLGELHDAVVRLALAASLLDEDAPPVERTRLDAVEHSRHHLVANLAVVHLLVCKLAPTRERARGGERGDPRSHLSAHVLQSRLLRGVFRPRAEAPRRRAVQKTRNRRAKLCLLLSRVGRVLQPLVERAVQLLIGETRGDPAKLLANVDDLLHLGSPPAESAGERALTHATRDDAHDVASALTLVKCCSPLDVEHHLETVSRLRLNIAADGVERGGFGRLHGPRAEDSSASALAGEEETAAGEFPSPLERHLPSQETPGEVLPAPQRHGALEILLLLDLVLAHAVGVLAPLRKSAPEGLAVPESKRVQLHDVSAPAPTRQRALERVAFPERDGDHPVLHSRLARGAKRAKCRRVSNPNPKRRRRQLEILVSALPGDSRILIRETVPVPRLVVVPPGAVPPSGVGRALVHVLLRDATTHDVEVPRERAHGRRTSRPGPMIVATARRDVTRGGGVHGPALERALMRAGRRGAAEWGSTGHRGAPRREPRALAFVFHPPVGIGVEREFEQEAVVIGVLLGDEAVFLEDSLVRLGDAWEERGWGIEGYREGMVGRVGRSVGKSMGWKSRGVSARRLSFARDEGGERAPSEGGGG